MDDEDPEVTVAKWMAFRQAQRDNRKKVHLLTWALALPVAWLAWKLQSYQAVMDWANVAANDGLTASEAERVRLLVEICTVISAWMITVTLLFPLRIYLRARWEVDPERFGMSPNGE